MTYKLTDVKFETHDFWVLAVGGKGYEVYRKGVTHSTRVARIGPGANLGLARAIDEARRRQSELDEGLTP